MDVSIVILNYNTRDELRTCLNGLLAEGSSSIGGGPLQAEVFVVDNASSDGSADMVAKEFPDVRVFRSPVNLGCAGANNIAFPERRGRSLQAGFQRVLDTSPLAYLRDLRLRAVHVELTRPENFLPVREVALKWGFTHMGRFAAQYREAFGVTPSETSRLAGEDGQC